MKRKEFVRQLLREGCIMLRPGSRHDVYMNPKTGQKQAVPRHTEIDNVLARHIRKYLGLETP
ncbi:MAG: addiction module toxin, HicA family [Candidatus Methylomirabilota bacterium]|nr:type II toxin-antitoxin system HicA family toxin [Candidatus Methylomirabilis sp.]PWB48687.1 MAG: addiction module toxin, HicA family [candidate division NC10 bacterium]